MEKPPEPGSKADKKSAEDEEILELAEEVLGSSDDEIIGLDDDAVVTADEDDEVIDLTDVSEPPLTEDDEILDLTNELEQADEGEDITIAEDDEIMELEDITDVSADTEVAILELDEAIDALAEPKEDILAPEDASDGEDEPIIDLRETAEESIPDSEPAAAGSAFSIENDTIELSETDHAELAQEFGFETEDEGLPDSAATAEEPPADGFLADTIEQSPADAIELTDTVDDEAQEPTGGQTDDFPEEPLELTAEDRLTLEEEIGADTIEDLSVDMDGPSEPAAVEDSTTAALEDQLRDIDEPLQEPFMADAPEEAISLDADSLVAEEPGGDLPEEAPTNEAEIRFDAEELSMADDDDDEPIRFGDETEEQQLESAPDDLRETMELADVNGEALQAEIDSEPVAEEVLDVGLDDEEPVPPEEPVAEETEASLAVEGLGLTDEPSIEMTDPGLSGSEEFMDESLMDTIEDETPLTAESLSAADTDSESEISVSEDRPHGITFDPEEDGPDSELNGTAANNGMSVDFDHTESFEQSDMHKDADPISIRVKEPTTEENADEDALLNKVFEPQAESVSPQMLQETVERVVGNMLAEKIEVLLAEAIEKAVVKEIGRLKQMLLDDLNRLE